MYINLIQIQKWSFGMWETSPPAAPLLLKERFDKTLVPFLKGYGVHISLWSVFSGLMAP